MKKGQASKTAENVAGFRALESFKPRGERILNDTYAVEFLSGSYRIIAKARFLLSSQLLVRAADWYVSAFIPGGINFDIAKARFIEDYLNGCLEGGLQQLVLLGAGYDSRAFRFNALQDKVRVFEVDHPDTQRAKKDKVKKIFGSLPDHVVYVPVDFGVDRLDKRLFASGYDRNLKTLFIWEGVIYYLTAESVDSTLSFIAMNSGEGSSVVFDYAYQSFVSGRVKGAKRMLRKAAQLGEPLTFGLDEENLDKFLAQRGFFQVRQMDSRSLDQAYFKGTNRRSSPCWAVAYAVVKARELAPSTPLSHLSRAQSDSVPA